MTDIEYGESNTDPEQGPVVNLPSFDYTDPLWHKAVQQQENPKGDPYAVSAKGAVGPMQTEPATLSDPGFGVTPAKDNSPDEMARVGHDYLVAMGNKYQDPQLALMAYNWGPGHVDEWLKHGAPDNAVPQETRAYVENIGKNYQKLKTTAQNSPTAYTQTTDPIMQALSATDEKNLSAGSNSPASDPIMAALSGEEAPKVPSSAQQSTPWYAKPLLTAVTAEKGFGQGLRDVGHGIQSLTGSTLGGLLNTPEEYAAKTADYEKTFGNPLFQQAGIHGATPGRIAGQIAGTAPLLSAGGEIVGGAANIASRAVPALETPLNFLTGNLESNAITNSAGEVTQGATLGNKVARLASTIPAGAAGGASANALVGQSPTQGAEIGAIFGPTASLVGAGISKLVGTAGENIAPYTNKLFQAFKRDGYPDVQAVQNKLTELGPNATLADLGPNTRDLTGAIAQAPGRGKEIIESALDDRHAGQVDRLTQLVTTGLGVKLSDTYGSVLSKIDSQQSAEAGPLYKEAFDANKDVKSPVIDRILETDAGKRALEFARMRMNNRMALMGVPDPELAEQMRLTGSYQPGGASQGLKLETLDLVKQGLDDQIAVKLRQGENGAASDLIALKKGLTNELDSLDATAKAGPNSTKAEGGAYARARATYADKAQAKDALDAGYDYITKGADTNVLNNLTDAQKTYFRIGAVNKINDVLNNAPDGADTVKRIFGSPAKRQALESIFPSKQAFDQFAAEVQNESTFAKTRQAVLKNSLTNSRLQASADLQTPLQKTVSNLVAGVGHASEFAQRTPVGQLIYGAKFLANKLMQPGILSQQESEALANALVTPQGRAEVIKTLTPSNGRQDLLNNYITALHTGGISALTNNKLSNPAQ